jgi:hypothetical protein
VRYCLLFQDDTTFHGEFHLHVANLVRGLPPDWIAAHLCPNNLARIIPEAPKRYKGPPVRGRDPALFVPLDPPFLDRNTSNNDTYYTRWPELTWANKPYFITVGRPVSFLLRQSRAGELLRLLNTVPKSGNIGGHDDSRLSRDTTIKDLYVARTPQLCYHMRSQTTVDTRQSNNTKEPYPYS